jgi:phospholipid-transporting ATPase
MLNGATPKAKTSRVKELINTHIVYLLVLQLFWTLLGGGLFISLNQNLYCKTLTYIDNPGSFVTPQPFALDLNSFFINVGTWILIFGNFVPISLLVSLETVNYIQGLIIARDDHMVHDEQFPEVHTSLLNEDLGMVTAVFSDKTGTLTRNEMNFNQICIHGKK